MGNRLFIAAVVVVLGLTAACAPVGGEQSASATHVVDGYRLGRESLCEPATSSICEVSAAVAVQTLKAKAPDAVVVRQVMAEPVCGDGHGLCTFGGLSQPIFMVFDLADGSRRVIGLMCEGEVTQDGRVVSEAQCTANDLPSLRAGASAGS